MQSRLAPILRNPLRASYNWTMLRSGGVAVNQNSSALIEQVSCVGIDGSPISHGGDEEKRGREEDEMEYYKHHKASPLSEIEVGDTRKPITRATDGTAYAGDAGERPVIGWREEQLDTAEEALERAVRIWKESAMRGDPDLPHSRVLRALRGELDTGRSELSA